MKLGKVPADSVDGNVRILEAESLAGYSHPGDASLGDVEGAHTQRLPVHVHLSVLLHTASPAGKYVGTPSKLSYIGKVPVHYLPILPSIKIKVPKGYTLRVSTVPM